MIKNVPLMDSSWLYRIVRTLFAGVFILAGASKLPDLSSFATLIDAYGIVPEPFVSFTAIFIPIVEIIFGIGLILDLPISLEILTALTILFIFVLWFGILHDLDIDCGCFSIGEQKEHDGLRAALYRDFVLLGVAAYLFFWRWRNSPQTIRINPFFKF